MGKLTVEDLAPALGEEFDHDDWGNIDPYLFLVVSEGAEDDSPETISEADELRRVLERVIERLNLA